VCGRFALTTSSGELLLHFGLSRAFESVPRYNVAPGQPILAVRRRGANGPLDVTHLRWGLVPGWAKDPAIGARLINARAETVAEKPSFRTAFLRRRCLVPMSAFYEWRKTGPRGGEPWAFRRADDGPFAVAGVWEAWQGPDGSELESCALLTTAPNDLVAPVHDRMPVILAPDAYEPWLDAETRPAALTALLVPFPARALRAHRVSPRVGDARVDEPGLLAPLPHDGTLELA
jgi:putative SOS response-associated peptidase YedK